MKKMKVFTLILGLFLCINLAYTQFQPCLYAPTGQDLWDVHFIDEDIGVAVGDSGTIIRSTDGGLFWYQVMENDTINFKKVKFFNAQVGLAIGSDIFKTTDAGKSWMRVDLQNDRFFDLEIVDESTCLVTGVPTALLKSTDFGETWEVLVDQNIRHDDYFNYDFGLLSFVDKNTGYNVSYGFNLHYKILKTIDGGQSWDTIYREITQAVNYELTTLEAFSFPEENLGFKGGWYNPLLQKTTDSGLTWNETTEDIGHISINDFHITKEMPNAYFACGWHNKIYKSSNQGDTWPPMQVDSFRTPYGWNKAGYLGIFFLNDSLGWVVGNYGTILKTKAATPGDLEQMELSIIPNPSFGNFLIYNPQNIDIKKRTLLDQSGRVLIKSIPENVFNIGNYPSGLYYLKIETERGVVVKKIIKN